MSVMQGETKRQYMLTLQAKMLALYGSDIGVY